MNATLNIGSNIKKLRELRNYTQEYVADKLGMSQTGYSKIERDETDISVNRLTQVAEVLNVKIADILGFSDKLIFNVNNSTQSGNGVFLNAAFSEKERELYEQQIVLLKEEVGFLKKQLEVWQGQFMVPK